MAPIWMDNPDGAWTALDPTGFALENELEEMVFRSIDMLPLSGVPVVVALATQVVVSTAGTKVDVLGVESTGTLVLIEIKLNKNQEARRAVVAQVLSYAASLKGAPLEQLESRLAAAGFSGSSIAEAVADHAVDEEAFEAAVAKSLAEGRFRLVLVLDDAPQELVELVGYLESISGGLLSIDLITVAVYQVGSRRVAVPQRIDPAHHERRESTAAGPSTAPPVLSERGADLFSSAIGSAPNESRTALREMADWALGIASSGWASLVSRQGTARTVLTPRVPGEDVGLCTLWNDHGLPHLRLHGTVLRRRAPNAEKVISARLRKEIGSQLQLKWSDVSADLLEELRAAYREASQPEAAGGAPIGSAPHFPVK